LPHREGSRYSELNFLMALAGNIGNKYRNSLSQGETVELHHEGEHRGELGAILCGIEAQNAPVWF
jgi:hypothetical protein